MTVSLSHHTHQIDIVVTTTVNQPSIIVVDVVWLLPNDAVTIMIGIILQQMNLMNTRRQMDEPQVAHSSHEDCLDDNRRTPPRVPPIRQGINMDRQQDRRYFLGMYKSLKYTGKTSWKAFYTKFRGYARTADGQKNKRKINFWGVWRTRLGSTSRYYWNVIHRLLFQK